MRTRFALCALFLGCAFFLSAQDNAMTIFEARASLSWNGGFCLDLGCALGRGSFEPTYNAILIGARIGWDFSRRLIIFTPEVMANLWFIKAGLEVPVWGNGTSYALALSPSLAFSLYDAVEIGGGYSFCLENRLDPDLSFSSPFFFLRGAFPAPLYAFMVIGF